MIYENRRSGMTPDQLLRAARRADELAAELDQLDPRLLAPSNPALVGHERLALALTEAEGSWRAALRVLRTDLRHIAEQFRASAAATERNDQYLARQLGQVVLDNSASAALMSLLPEPSGERSGSSPTLRDQ